MKIRRQGRVVMGLVRKAASILRLGGVSSPRSRESQEEAARAQAKAARAQAGLAEAEARVAQEQAVAIARALHEDEAHRHEDLEEVAEEEAEACRGTGQPTTEGGIKAARSRPRVALGDESAQAGRRPAPGHRPGSPATQPVGTIGPARGGAIGQGYMP